MSGLDEAFGPIARHLAGLAARLLGWRPTEFWDATPAELAAALNPPDAAAPIDRAARAQMMEHDDA